MKYNRRSGIDWSFGQKVAMPNELDVILMTVEDLYRLTIDIATSKCWHNRLHWIKKIRPSAGKEMLVYTSHNKPAEYVAVYNRWASVFNR